MRRRASSGTQAVEYWSSLTTDDDAVFDAEVDHRRRRADAVRHLGHESRTGTAVVGERVRIPELIGDDNERSAAERALEYMGLTAGTPLREIHVDTVFLGSCTNGRIEDLRAAADILRGTAHRPDAADAGRSRFDAGEGAGRGRGPGRGFHRRPAPSGGSAGCSMCLGMNPDQLAPGERSASTSNRNFEGRQGKGGRTHLVSPLVAAATAVRGTLSSPADLDPVPALAGATLTDRQPRGPRRSDRSSPPPARPVSPTKLQGDNDGRLPHATPESGSRCAAATSTPIRSSRPCT